MELIGLNVKHKMFGAGVITGKVGNQENQIITVKFDEKTIRFSYPDAFEKYLEAEDPIVQQDIMREIIDKNSATIKEKNQPTTTNTLSTGK